MDPVRQRTITVPQNTQRTAQGAIKGSSSRNPFRRLVAWLRATKLGKIWRQHFSRATPPVQQRPLAQRRVAVAARPVVKPFVPPSAPVRPPAVLRTKSKAPTLATIPEDPEPIETLAKPPAELETHRSDMDKPVGAATKEKVTAPPNIQSVLVSTLEQLASHQERDGISGDEKLFCVDAYQELSLLALDDKLNPAEIIATLRTLLKDEDMPDAIHTQLTTQLKSASKLASTNAKAHAQFLAQVDMGLVDDIIASPPELACQAAQLRGEAFYKALEDKYGLQPSAGGGVANPDDIPAFKTYLTRLGADMRKEAPWLADGSPATQAFLDAPSHDSLRTMLADTTTGHDIMRQTWLHNHLVLAPEHRSAQYKQRNPKSSHLRPYSMAQQLEFCEHQFGIHYQNKMQPLTRSPQAQMASGVFVAQRLAQRHQDINPEMFALGHMLLLAKQGKLGLRESAHIYRAITSDARPMVNFVYRSATSRAPERIPTRTSQASIRQHKTALAQPLPSYYDLPEYFSDPDITTRLGFTLFSALRDVTQAST